MIPRPCGGVNEDLLAYGEPLVAIWSEDPNGVGVDANPIATWPNAGSLGGDFVAGGGGQVLYDQFSHVRPAFRENGNGWLEITTAAQSLPGTLVAVAAIGMEATVSGVVAAYVDAALAGGVGALFGNWGTVVNGELLSSTYAGSLGTGGGHSVFQPANAITSFEGRGVVGANDQYRINDGGLFDSGTPIPGGETADTFSIYNIPPGIATLKGAAIFFAAWYATPTAPDGLMDAIRAHYGIVP